MRRYKKPNAIIQMNRDPERPFYAAMLSHTSLAIEEHLKQTLAASDTSRPATGALRGAF